MALQHRPPIRLSEPQKRLLWHLRVGGAAPRIRLADALGIGNGAMTRLSRELAALGLVEEQPQENAQARGRPVTPLALSGEGGYAVGATAHPGWIEIVIVDFAGRTLARDVQRFDSPDPRDFATAVDARLRTLAADIGVMRRRFLGLGIAVPGYVLSDDRRWVVEWLAGWRDVPLARFFDDALGLPVWIENEATAAALAEYYRDGVIGRYRSVLVFFLSHGVGAGVVAERDLFRGEHGNAGEIGRLFPGSGPRPSGIDLLRMLRGNGVAIDSLAGLDGVAEDHRASIDQWLDRVAGQLRLAIAGGVAWLDPGAVIVSGALPQRLLDGLAARLTGWDESGYRGAMPHILASRLGSGAVALGAAMVPIHALTAQTITR